jgi:predicted phosphodiesterase
MTIFFAGDCHGQFQHIIAAVKEHRPEAVIFLGDLQAQASLDEVLAEILPLTQFAHIPGNHDTDSVSDYDHLWGSKLADQNLHGRVIEIAGVRVAGLGGIFRQQVWHPPSKPEYSSETAYLAVTGKGNRWRDGLPLRHRSTIFPNVYQNLSRQRADVLVTHEAPSCHPHGFEAIDLLAAALGAQRVYHGHHHDRMDYSGCTSALGFSAYGVGLRGITNLSGMIIRPGELDAQRSGRSVWPPRHRS